MQTSRRFVVLKVVGAAIVTVSAILSTHGEALYAQKVGAHPKNSRAIEVVDLSQGRERASGIKFAAPEGGEPVVVHLGKDETPAISPNAVLAGILKFARPGQTKASLRIYDETGTQIRAFEVAPLDKIALADDGGFAVYGFEPTTEVAFVSKLKFYRRDGEEAPSPTRLFGVSHRGVFSQTGRVFVFLAAEKAEFRDPRRVVLLLFDEEFQSVGTHTFEDWPLYSPLQVPIIDEDKGLVKLFLATGEGVNLTKETMFVDFSGAIKETRKGWVR